MLNATQENFMTDLTLGLTVIVPLGPIKLLWNCLENTIISPYSLKRGISISSQILCRIEVVLLWKLKLRADGGNNAWKTNFETCRWKVEREVRFKWQKQTVADSIFARLI